MSSPAAAAAPPHANFSATPPRSGAASTSASTPNSGSDSDEDEAPIIFDRVSFREARAADAPALRELFAETLPGAAEPSFFADVAASLRGSGAPPGDAAAARLTAHLAVDAGHLVGAIVVGVNALEAARTAGWLPCDVLDAPPARDARAAAVLLVAVWPRYRRAGVGTELIARGLAGAALDDARVVLASLHTRARDAGAAAFFDAVDFARVGRVPAHLRRRARAARATRRRCGRGRCAARRSRLLPAAPMQT